MAGIRTRLGKQVTTVTIAGQERTTIGLQLVGRTTQGSAATGPATTSTEDLDNRVTTVRTAGGVAGSLAPALALAGAIPLILGPISSSNHSTDILEKGMPLA